MKSTYDIRSGGARNRIAKPDRTSISDTLAMDHQIHNAFILFAGQLVESSSTI